ncbi:hypothetical protein [Paraburkholderia tagetis]|uniref:OmpA family protein n=1 Tax=Paraburkholderia tagetis TaxID=2913261 RepID=A0A9X1RSJ3_9BURK|nr:hypothetical protein [Paraburkholderia tagetis]MCG5075207.1 hypothetical protein [Paraburkholderia tagetis]
MVIKIEMREKMKSCILLAAFSTFSIFSSQSLAECKGSQNMPGEQISLPFKKNEKSLSPEDAKRLKDWADSMNGKYPIQQWLSIGAYAQPNEYMPDTLSISRGVSIAKLALDDGLVKAPIEIKSHVGSIGNPGSYDDESRSVTLQLSPGCPDNCCDGK